MRFFLVFLTVLFLLFSCGKNAVMKDRILTDKTEKKITIYSKVGGKQPLFEILFTDGKADLDLLADFAGKSIMLFEKYSRPSDALNGTFRFESDGNLYQLFFYLGVPSTSDFKNEVIRYGLLQTAWRNWVMESGKRNDRLSVLMRKEAYDLYRIPEFKKLFTDSRLDENEIGDVYPYTVRYLLKNLLFISIQEFLSRPSRYYNMRELQTFFLQVVTIPEAAEFTAYLENKFGRERVIRAGKTEFSKESWKKIFDEEIQDSETVFTESVESKIFNGVYQNMKFTFQFDRLLELYNRMTKPTMFKK